MSLYRTKSDKSRFALISFRFTFPAYTLEM